MTSLAQNQTVTVKKGRTNQFTGETTYEVESMGNSGNDQTGNYANPEYVPEVNVGAEVGQAAAKAGANIVGALLANVKEK